MSAMALVEHVRVCARPDNNAVRLGTTRVMVHTANKVVATKCTGRQVDKNVQLMPAIQNS